MIICREIPGVLDVDRRVIPSSYVTKSVWSVGYPAYCQAYAAKLRICYLVDIFNL